VSRIRIRYGSGEKCLGSGFGLIVSLPCEEATIYLAYFVPAIKEHQSLKGLSHEIFGPVYWPVWMHLGLSKNRFWFLNFKGAPSIWGRQFKFLCVSVQTLSEILATEDLVAASPSPRTGVSVANHSPRNGDSVANHSRRFYDSPINISTLSSVSRRTTNQKSTKIGELQAQLPIILRDSRISENAWPETRQNLK
jgi:hypothetical protein